jgi:hypothetical protein
MHLVPWSGSTRRLLRLLLRSRYVPLPLTLLFFRKFSLYFKMAVSSQEQKLAAENLYRDANTLIYGDNKPSEDAIDRVVGKINKECVLS